jgi:hypothetical protein
MKNSFYLLLFFNKKIFFYYAIITQVSLYLSIVYHKYILSSFMLLSDY